MKIDQSKKYDFISPTKIMGVKSPLEYFNKRYILERKITDAMIFGTAVHTYILEAHKFSREFFVLDESKRPKPDKNFQTKENKEWRDGIKEKCEKDNLKCLTLEQYDKIKTLKELIASQYDFYQDMIDINEESFVEKMFEAIIVLNKEFEFDYIIKYSENLFDELKNNVNCHVIRVRTKIDYAPKSKEFITDFKTTDDISLKKFSRTIADRDYHLQAAMEIDILRACFKDIGGGFDDDTFFLMVLDTSDTPDAAVMIIEQEAIDYGRFLYRKRLTEIYKCFYYNQLKGVSINSKWDNEIISISVPKYSINYDVSF
jgi:hypothetical protein